jgi:hypothetical protein
MAGGPIKYFSAAYPASGQVYPGYHIGTTNNRKWHGHRCEASLGSDAILELNFEAPQSLPSGTPKLRCLVISDDTSGDGVINPAWASLPVGGDYDTVALNAEGNTTITWATGDNEELLEEIIVLDADTVVEDEIIIMQITFVSASWTLASISTWNFSIIWE